jgi:hypothetical protein
MAADVDSPDSFISRRLATQLLDLIQYGQDPFVKYRHFSPSPAKSSILLTFLADLGDPFGRQRTQVVAPLLTPGQDEIAVQFAAGAMTVRIAAAAGDLIDTALDKGGAGHCDLESLPKMLPKFEQFSTQATELASR